MPIAKYIGAPIARALGIRYPLPAIAPLDLLYPPLAQRHDDGEEESDYHNIDMPLTTVHLLTLADDGSPDIVGNYINLPPPTEAYTLRFAIEGASSICREGKLWVNIPTAGEEFEREKFQSFE